MSIVQYNRRRLEGLTYASNTELAPPIEKRGVGGNHDRAAVRELLVELRSRHVWYGRDAVCLGLFQGLIHKLSRRREIKNRLARLVQRRLSHQQTNQRLATT